MVDKALGIDGAPKNPMFRCRIFVGNLPTDFLTKPDVLDRFSKYGIVSEVSLHRGFAFLQFKNTEDASAAIKGEKGTMFKGSEIDCSFAKHEKGSKNAGPVRGKSPPRGGSVGGGGGRFDDRDKDRDRLRDFDRDRLPSSYDRDREGPPRGRERSPLRDRYDDRYRDSFHRDEMLRRDRFYDERRSPPRRDPRDLDLYDRDRLPPSRDGPYRRDDPRDDPFLRDLDRERDFLARDRDDPYRRDRGDPFDRERDPYERERDLFRDRDMRDRDLVPREPREPREAPREPREAPREAREPRESREPREPIDRRGGPPPIAPGRGGASGPVGADPSLDGPIDCEIIVVNKAQREYAETVQRRVKSVQLQVGIIYLNSEMSLSNAMDDVSRRGVLYAILLTSQHEMHKSVTVNILHGTPQEHRNMPLEDAMSLIGRNFDRYMQNLREKSGLPPGPVGPSRTAPPPISPPQRQQAPQPAGAGPPAPGPSNIDLTIPQLLNLLADGKQLTIDELARVIEFLQELRQRMIRDRGGDPSAQTKDFGSSSGLGAPSGGGGSGYGNNNGGRKEVDMDLDSDEDSGQQQKPPNPNAQIQAKILNMIRPGGGAGSAGAGLQLADTGLQLAGTPPVLPAVVSLNIKRDMPPMGNQPPSKEPRSLLGQPPKPPVVGQPFVRPPSISQAPPMTHAPPPPPSAAMMRAQRPPAPPPAVSSGNINFDNPNVKKALDNLISSGPNLLRTIGQASSGSGSTSTTPSQAATSATSQVVNNLAAQQAMQAQYAAQYQVAAAQQNAMLQAQMQAHASYRQMNPGQQQQPPPGMPPQGYMMQGPRYGGHF